MANAAQLHGGELQPGRRRRRFQTAAGEGGGQGGRGGGAQDVDVLGVRDLAGEHGHAVADVTQTRGGRARESHPGNRCGPFVIG